MSQTSTKHRKKVKPRTGKTDAHMQVDADDDVLSEKPSSHENIASQKAEYASKGRRGEKYRKRKADKVETVSHRDGAANATDVRVKGTESTGSVEAIALTSVEVKNGNGAQPVKRHRKMPAYQKDDAETKESKGRSATKSAAVKVEAKGCSSSQDVTAQKSKVTSKGRKAEKSVGVGTASDASCSGARGTRAMFVGAHCSIAGGVSNAVSEAVSIGARSFGLFVRNGRTWKLAPLKDGEAEKFKAACKEHGFPPHLILPHGSYLLNCGATNSDVLSKSRDTLIHELKICEALGLTLYNFHPGSACGDGSVETCIQRIADSINLAHSKTKIVKTVIENMSCQGQTVGGKLEELKAIIDRVTDKSRIGVCLDTCHAFAAGFDLSTDDGLQSFMKKFESIVGLQYLSGMHLNDSKGELGCHLDRHENIGKGKIVLAGFRSIMNDLRFANIPMILETPVNDYAAEIRTLYSLEENKAP